MACAMSTHQEDTKGAGFVPPSRQHVRQSKEQYAEELRIESCAAQKEAFTSLAGRGAWEQCYTPSSEVGRESTSPQSLHNQLWRGVDSRAFKLFQQLFVERKDWVFPGNLRDADLSSPELFPNQHQHPTSYSIIGCLINPKRVRRLCETLGLIPEVRSEKEGLRSCSDPKVLMAVKYIFECLRPLKHQNNQDKNYRLLFVGAPSERVERTYAPIFKKLGMSAPSDIIGSIIHTRAAPLNSKSAAYDELRELTHQHFSSAYKALRQTHHEEQRYSVEQKELLDLLGAWDLFRASTLPRWVSRERSAEILGQCRTERERKRIETRLSETNTEIVQEYCGLLERSIEYFQGSVHFAKRRILKRLYKMCDRLPTTDQGRINPSPVDLQAMANSELKELRLDDIRAKGSYNRRDQMQLDELVVKHVGVFADLRRSLIWRANAIQGQLDIFEPARRKDANREQLVQSARDKLALPVERIERMCVKPFVQASTAIISANHALIEALKAGSRGDAREALSKMFFTTQVVSAMDASERLREALVNPKVDLSQALTNAKALLGTVYDRKHLYQEPTTFEQSSSATAFRARVQKVGRAIVRAHAALAKLVQHEAAQSSKPDLNLTSREGLVAALDKILEDSSLANFLEVESGS